MPVSNAQEDKVSEPRKVTVKRLRIELRDILEAAEWKSESTIVTKHGRPVAVVGPIQKAAPSKRRKMA